LRAGQARHALDLSRLGHRLAGQSPQARLARAGSRLEALDARARQALSVASDRRKQRVETASRRLAAALAARVALGRSQQAAHRQRLQLLHERMARAFAGASQRRSASVASLAQLLRSLGYRNVLARGFALVRDGEGRPMRLAAAVPAGARLDIEWADGHVAATADGEPPATLRRPAKRAPKPKQQESLF
jgi:exodeoxyribonuclease VII large subunit